MVKATIAAVLLQSSLSISLRSASTSIGNPSNPSTGSSASIAAPDGMYSGRDKYPISFTVTSGVITDLHGTVTLYCAGGPSPISQESPYSDADRIQLDSSGSFSDDYHYAVGNGTWTLHIDGTLTGDGTATGFVSILGVGCSAGRTGWAAALPGAQLPVAPASPPPASAVACTPQPCQTLNGVTLSVQSATLVSKPDDPSANDGHIHLQCQTGRGRDGG